MGLVHEKEVRTVTAVSCVYISVLVRSHIWYDGHLSPLNQVDFDLRAHLYAQFNERLGFAPARGFLSSIWRASSVRP